MPSDGHPLPGYALALNDVEKRGSHPSQSSLDAAGDAGVAPAAKTQGPRAGQGGAKDDEDDDASVAAGPVRVAAAEKATRRTTETELRARLQAAAVPLPQARPVQLAQNKSATGNSAAIASRDRSDRSDGLVQVDAALAGSRIASVDAAINSASRTASLAYATTSDVSMPARGAVAPVAESIVQKSPAPVPMKAQRFGDPPLVAAVVTSSAKARNADDIWTRAMLLAPDLQNFMSATLLGAPDFKQLRDLMQKPSLTLAMSFSDDPDLGASADRIQRRDCGGFPGDHASDDPIRHAAAIGVGGMGLRGAAGRRRPGPTSSMR